MISWSPKFAATRLLQKISPSQMTRKYNTSLKVPPMLVCMKNTALACMSWESYSTRLCFMLCESLDTLPHAVFSLRGGASTITYQYIASAVSQYSTIQSGVHWCMLLLERINDQCFENSTTMYNTFDCQPIITNNTGMLKYHYTWHICG